MNKLMVVILTFLYALVYIVQHHFEVAWWEYVIAFVFYFCFTAIFVISEDGNKKCK